MPPIRLSCLGPRCHFSVGDFTVLNFVVSVGLCYALRQMMFGFFLNDESQHCSLEMHRPVRSLVLIEVAR